MPHLLHCYIGLKKDSLGKVAGLRLIEHILENSTGSGDSVNISAALELMKEMGIQKEESHKTGYMSSDMVLEKRGIQISLVKVFRIIPEFRILRLTFHRKSASKF